VAHALIQADDEIARMTGDIDTERLWARPGEAAAIGFHLAHLTRALDRLVSYARGDELDPAQRERLASERTLHEDRPPLADLLAEWARVKRQAMAQLETTDPAVLSTPRFVGRARLPSTTLGLLFHAAEHTTRHVGQMVTTQKALEAQRDEDPDGA